MAKGQRRDYAFCTLCVADKRWEVVKVKYSSKKATSNLINHLDSDECLVHGISTGICAERKDTFTAFFKPNDEDQKKLVRWMVDTN